MTLPRAKRGIYSFELVPSTTNSYSERRRSSHDYAVRTVPCPPRDSPNPARGELSRRAQRSADFVLEDSRADSIDRRPIARLPPQSNRPGIVSTTVERRLALPFQCRKEVDVEANRDQLARSTPFDLRHPYGSRHSWRASRARHADAGQVDKNFASGSVGDTGESASEDIDPHEVMGVFLHVAVFLGILLLGAVAAAVVLALRAVRHW